MNSAMSRTLRSIRPGEGDDHEEFGVVLWSHASDVHAYLARRCPSVADDLLSEVFVSAFVGREGFDPRRGTLRAWMFGIARNTLANHFRAERSRGAPLHDMSRDAWDEWTGVDARLDAAQTMRAVRRSLATMPAEEREVLLLVAWEDLSPTEAAQVLSIPAGTARSRLHRARRRLAREPDLVALSPIDPTTEQGGRETI